MLTAVLLCFSGALYFLVSYYCDRQVENRLNSILSTLRSAVETEAEGLEWEPATRMLVLGFAPLNEPYVWLVSDAEGRTIDVGSAEFLSSFLHDAAPVLKFDSSRHGITTWRSREWIASQEWIEAAYLHSTDPSNVDLSANQDQDPRPTYRVLSITVGVSLIPTRTTLRHLALTLISLSAAVWIVALLAGRFVCRRALRPISHMADAAAEIDADNLALRLPPITSPDELGMLNRSFNGLLERMQTAFERQQRFAGDASHQLRTPLSAILGQTEVTLRRERTVEEYQRILKVVHNRASHLAAIVESLLFLSRADSDSQRPLHKPIDLHKWLPEFLSTWQDHPRFADLRVEISSSSPATIIGHPILLTELCGIVIENALKFTKPGTFIDIRLQADHQWARFSVEDHGEGIATTDLEQIGRPFFRTEAARKQGIQGVGLGLSIAQRLARLFGGQMTFSSQLGLGTTVCIELPVTTEPIISG